MFWSSRRFTALRSTRKLIECTHPRSKRRGGPPRRCSCSRQLPIRLVSVILGILLLPAAAWAYRPFVSTDAAVAGPKEGGVGLRHFYLRHSPPPNKATQTHLVLNFS